MQQRAPPSCQFCITRKNTQIFSLNIPKITRKTLKKWLKVEECGGKFLLFKNQVLIKTRLANEYQGFL